MDVNASVDSQAEINRLQAENVNLRLKLDAEKQKCAAVQEDMEQLKRLTTNLNIEVEQEEEKITNMLLKKIETLQKERAQIMQTVEEEEEYITNTLQKKLDQLRREKVEMENALEQEQEFIVNKLRAELDRRQDETKSLREQLEQMRKEKVELENVLEQEQEAMFNRLQKKLELLEDERVQLKRQLSRSPQLQRRGEFEETEEVKHLRALLIENEQKQKQKDLEYKADQERLKDENLHLRQRVTRELERCRSLERDLTMLERDMEMEEEMQFNLLTAPQHNKSTPSIMRSVSGGSPRPSATAFVRCPSLEMNMPMGTKWWAKRSEPHSHHHNPIFDGTEFRRHSTQGTAERRHSAGTPSVKSISSDAN